MKTANEQKNSHFINILLSEVKYVCIATEIQKAT
jgi:hypothetical protein